MVLQYMFLSLYDAVTDILCVSLLSHNRYQYDSLILSKGTWAYTTVAAILFQWYQGHWCGADVMKEYLEKNFHLSSMLLRKLCVQYANSFDTT